MANLIDSTFNRNKDQEECPLVCELLGYTFIFVFTIVCCVGCIVAPIWFIWWLFKEFVAYVTGVKM